ncbi:MAG: Tryptophanyl-tRNA synthetase, partial [uncultured Frankineae bacterium]
VRVPPFCPPARPVRHPPDGGGLPPGQLPGRRAPLGGHAGRGGVLLLPGRPARADRAARPRAPARAHPVVGRGAAGDGGRPGPQRGLRPVAPAGARGAGLGAGVPHRLRRGQPDDAVQGEGRLGVLRRLRRPVHLPGAAGGRHPDVPGARRADRRGPAPAPRAHPRPGPALQRAVRRDVRGAGPVRRHDRRAHQGPAGPGPQDEQDARRSRHPVGARRAAPAHQEGEERRHGHRPGGRLRRRAQARHQQPPDRPRGVHRHVRGRRAGAVRRAGLRRLQGRGGRGGGRAVRADPGPLRRAHGRSGRARPRAGRRCGPRRRGGCRHDGVGARADRAAHPAGSRRSGCEEPRL